MDLSRLMRQTVTVHTITQDGTPDDFGDPTETEVTATHRGYAWQASADEDTAGGQVERERWKLAIAVTAEGLSAGDRVTVDGVVFDIAGPPWPAKNARTGRTEYLLADMYRSVTVAHGFRFELDAAGAHKVANGTAAKEVLEQAARDAATEVRRLAPRKRGFFNYRRGVRPVRARIVGTTLEAGVEVRSPGWHLPEYGTTELRATAPIRRGVAAVPAINFREE